MAATLRLMRSYLRPGSAAELKRHPRAAAGRAAAAGLAPGLQPTPAHDLKFRGGRTIAQLRYMNFFVGGQASWTRSDMNQIDAGLAAAMGDPGLNNVLRQYFANQPISTTFLGSHLIGTTRPRKVTQRSVERAVAALFQGGALSGVDFPSTVVNLMLPAGTVLTDGSGPGRAQHDDDDDRPHAPGTPEHEEASSLDGLGGYHGSIDLAERRIYYAVGAFSQRLADGRENGIAVFDLPWKNVVATFYHELCEARTDPDVEQAIRTNRVDGVIGWNSDEGEEVGDFPVFEAGGNLSLVFQEVPLSAGDTAPVQLQYSNAVHGPEGPIETPHHLAIAHVMA